MALFSSKKKLLFDLDRGIVGTLKGFDSRTSQTGFVYPVFYPIGSLLAHRYAQAVPESALYPVVNVHDLVGAEPEILFIFKNDEDSLVRFIDRAKDEKIRKLKEQIEDLKIKLASAKQQVTDANSDVRKSVSKARSVVRSPQDDDLLKKGLFPLNNDL